MTVEQVRGNWLTRLELRGLRMARGDTVLAAVDTLRLGLRPWALFGGTVDLSSIELAGPEVSSKLVAALAESQQQASPARAPTSRSRFDVGFNLRVDRLAIRQGRYENATLDPSNPFMVGVALVAHELRLGTTMAARIDSLSLQVTRPEPASKSVRLDVAGSLAEGRVTVSRLHLSGPGSALHGRGTVSFDASDSTHEMEIELQADPIDLGDLSLLIPHLDWSGDVTTNVALSGPRLDALSGNATLACGPLRLGSLHFGASRLGADFAGGRADIEATIIWEEARAALRGWMRPLDQRAPYDLELDLDKLPSRLPGTPWWVSFSQRAACSTHLRIHGHGYVAADLEVEGDFVSGAGRIGLAGGLRLRPDLEWDVQRLAFENFDLARWAGAATASSLTGKVTGSGRGTAAESLRISTTWDLGASHYGVWELASCTGRARLEGHRLHGTMKLETPTGRVGIDSVNVRLAPDIAIEIPAVHFRDLDLARITGNESVSSDLSGVLRLEATARQGSGNRTSTPPFLQRLDATGKLVLDTSRFRDQEIERAEATLHLQDGRVDASLAATSGAGRVELQAEARPFQAPVEVTLNELRFNDIDMRSWVNAPASTHLSGVLSGQATAPSGDGARTRKGGPSLEGWGPFASWSAALRLDPSAIGSLAIQSGEVSASAAAETFDGHVLLRTGLGDATLDAHAVPGENGPSGTAQIAVPLAILTALTGHDSLRTDGGIRVDATFAGIDPHSARLQGRITGRGRLDDWQIDSLSTMVHLANGALVVDTLALRSNAATVSGSGRLAIADSTRTPPSDLRLVLHTGDASRLRSLLRADTLALATGRLEAHITGYRSRLAVGVQATLDSLMWNEVTLENARVDARAALDPAGHFLASTANAHLARLQRHALHIDETDAQATFDGKTLRGGVTAHLDETHQVVLAAEGSRDSAGLRVILTDAAIDTPVRHWTLLRPAQLLHSGERWSLDSLEVRSQGALMLAHGTLDHNGEQDFSVQLHGLDLSVIAASLEREDLGGVLDARITVTGPGTAPHIEGSVRAVATASGLPAGVLSGTLNVADSQARMRVDLVSATSDSMVIVASAPFRRADTDSIHQPAGALDNSELHATASHFPLATLFPLLPSGAVSKLQGHFDADLRLSRRDKQVQGSGRFGITDATIGLPSMGVVYQDIQLLGVLDGDRVVLREGRLHSEEGELRLDGTVRVSSLSQITPDLKVNFQDLVAVSAPDLRVQASGELQLSGSLKAPELTGRLTANKCTYYITDATLSGSQTGSGVTLTPADLRMLEENFGRQYRPGTSPFLGVYDASSLDLQVSLDHDNWVRKRRSPRLALEVTGDVHVRKPAHGELDLRGRLVPGRGTIEQFGRTFDFVGGQVLLNGPMSDHTVDIRTEYKSRTPGTTEEPDVVVHLDVKSEADNLRLVLSSEPPLSETEIISYITTGRSPVNPQAPSGTGSDAAALAADIGLSQVTGVLEDVVQEKVGLDVLQVRYDAIQGATLMAGRYLNSSLYVGVRQPLQYREAGLSSSQHPYQTTIEAEYAAYRWLLFDVQGEASLVRSFVRARHEY